MIGFLWRELCTNTVLSSGVVFVVLGSECECQHSDNAVEVI